MRFNARGQAALGVGDGIVSIDGRAISPGGGVAWIDDDKLLFQRSPDYRLCLYDGDLGTITRVSGEGANQIAAGGNGGRWAAWLAGYGLYTSDGIVKAEAGLLDVGPDGDLAFVPNRQTGVGFQIDPDGSGTSYIDTDAIVYDFRCAGHRCFWYRTPSGQLRSNFIGPILDIVGERMYRPVLLSINAEWWVLYATGEPGDLRARPVNSPMGVIVDDATLDHYYNHDAIVIGPDWRVKVGWSLRAGELPDDLRTKTVDLRTLPRVDFRQAAHPAIPDVAPAPFFYDVGFYKDHANTGPGTCRHVDGTGLVRRDTGAVIAVNLDPVSTDSDQWRTPGGTIWYGCTPAQMFITDPPADPAAEAARRLADAMRGHEHEPTVVTLQADTRVDGQHQPRWNEAQLAALVFSYPALIAQYPNVNAVVLFAHDRAGGLQDHPWLVPFYERWVASLPPRPSPPTPPNPPQPPEPTMKDRLQPGDVLRFDETRRSPNDRYMLVLQRGDGNLVVHRRDGVALVPLWGSGTGADPTGAVFAAMQGDGNLVIHRDGVPIWGTMTQGHPGAHAQLQDDGNLVIVHGGVALWGSGADLNPPPIPPSIGRRGLVRLQGRAWQDDDGLFLPLGVSWFCGPWAWRHDRPKAIRALEKMRGKVDYARVFGEVGSASWADRVINPTLPGYEADLAELIDTAYDVYGVRLQITIFADGGMFEPMTVTFSRWIRIAMGREHKILLIEGANEDNYGNETSLFALIQNARTVTPYLWAVHSPDDGGTIEGARALLDATDAQVATFHRDRTRGDMTPDGRSWRSVRQSRDYADVQFAVSDNEPAGPKSSGEEERDPLVLAMTRATGALHGIGAYVFHPGAGIRGGGQWDQDHHYGNPPGPRAIDFDTEPGFDAVLAALRAVTSILPADLPNWRFVNGHWADHPLPADRIWTDTGEGHGCVRNYGAISPDGREFFTLPHGIRDRVTFTPRRPCRMFIFDPLTGFVLREAVDAFTLRPPEIGGLSAVVIRGTFL